MAKDGGVEQRVASGLKYIQFHCFSKMSRFSKFCKFLSENGEGLKLVAFYIAVQQLFIAHNEQDPDFPLLKGLLRLGFTYCHGSKICGLLKPVPGIDFLMRQAAGACQQSCWVIGSPSMDMSCNQTT